MTHDECMARIDAEDALPATERAQVERHAAACAVCAAALARARAIRQAARALPGALAPARDGWPQVAEAIAAASTTGRTEPATGAAAGTRVIAPRSGRRWRFAGVAAAAALAAAVAIATVIAGRGRQAALPRPPLQATELDAAALSMDTGLHAGLARECMGAGRSLQASWTTAGVPAGDPATAALSNGLAILERSIDETRSALVAAPGDPQLAAMLAQRYRQKLALLQAALLRSETT